MKRRLLTIDGLPVVDATEDLVLQVVKTDIDMRKRRDPECCALSEACKRELGASRALTYLRTLYVLQGDHWVRYTLSEPAAAEVKLFDRGGGFQTGEYRVKPPQQRDQSGKYDRWKHGLVTEQAPRGYRKTEGVRFASPLYGGAIEPGKRPG